MIGDPSGVSEERNLLDPATLAKNLEGITVGLEKLLDFSPGPHQARLVDNYTWTSQVGLLDFLRDTGKYVTVNQMTARESVRARMDTDSGISYTEFTYQLLQAFDFCWLYEHEHCEMQMGGSDQWGNIVTGIDLIRKRLGATAFGLTWPLLLKADGTKFGKSAGGAVWLDPDRTSPYLFRQFFVQVDDADVERQLLQFTLLSVEEIEELMVAHRELPEGRRAQRVLRPTMTALVHGEDAARAADSAAEVLFGGDPTSARSRPSTRGPRGADDGGGRCRPGRRARPDQRADPHGVGSVERRGPPLAVPGWSGGQRPEGLGRRRAQSRRPPSRPGRPLAEGKSTYHLLATGVAETGRKARRGSTPRRRICRLTTRLGRPLRATSRSSRSAGGRLRANRHHHLLREAACRRALVAP